VTTDWTAPTLADVLRARRTIAPYLRPTPVLVRPELDAALGFHAFGKCEHLNPTGAFKVRGGVNLVASMGAEDRSRGVLAVSTGNHAQSVAYAARLFGVTATIYMPERANPVKVAATRALGAEVVQVGRDFDEAREACEERAGRSGARYIHSADEPLLVAGVGTYALELLEEVPDLEAIFVPVGGGSGALGTAVVARAVNPAIRVIGVQAEGAPAVYRSWKEGRAVETSEVTTFAEGLATRRAFALPMALLPRLVDEIMLVSDAELGSAMRLLATAARQIVEPAGAAGVAAAMRRRDEFAGRRVGLVLSGGNVPIEQFLQIIGSHVRVAD
jgi:threonine dehydratase